MAITFITFANDLTSMMLLFSRDIQQSVLPQLDIPTDQLVSKMRGGEVEGDVWVRGLEVGCR